MEQLIGAFLAPALSIAGLATFLAVLILVAERYLMDYGEVRLKINNEKDLTVKGGETLLNTLKGRDIFVPSACGGRATCAYCKVKVESGVGELLPTEAPLLSKEEIAEGVRLSCQVKVKRDTSIEIPEELFHIKEFKAELVEATPLTYDIKWFHFKLVEPRAIEYKAGQYVQFQAPEYGDCAESVYRAYSMCGVPGDDGRIDLMVRLVPDGLCTTFMFEYLDAGEEVVITGPYGDFYLRDSDRKMILIAGGSGMAPIRSIIRSMTREQIARREPVFFFGARSRRDLFLVEEWAELEKEYPGLRFVPALSGPEEDDNWDGETGRVTEIVPRFFDDLSNGEAYLCGSPGMLDSCVDMLTSMGMPEERIYYDKFA